MTSQPRRGLLPLDDRLDRSESHAVVDSTAAKPFHPPRRSDEPPDRNVWTLRNGERLDTPERFFDWLECHYRDHVDAQEPGILDRLLHRRSVVELTANQRLRRSLN